MRAGWRAPCGLVDSITTLTWIGSSNSTKHKPRAAAVLDGGPAARVPGDRELEPEDRNAIYRLLVHAVQGRARGAARHNHLVVRPVPGLDAVHRRQRRYFVLEPDELASLISVVFTTLVAGLDLQSVQRVAATLIRTPRARWRELAASAGDRGAYRAASRGAGGRTRLGRGAGGARRADGPPGRSVDGRSLGARDPDRLSVDAQAAGSIAGSATPWRGRGAVPFGGRPGEDPRASRADWGCRTRRCGSAFNEFAHDFEGRCHNSQPKPACRQ